MPSTVLSQDDSGIGIKNGINWRGYKNFLGTFSPPFAVINDLDLLKTLPLDIMRDGLAEAFKVAIIKDRAFFDFLSEKAAQLKVGSPEVLHTVVKRCAELHMEHIASSGDPFEMGNSRPLDFGHWSAHRLESMSGYSVRHGQAVAIGIALDTLYACKLGLISSADLALVLDALEAVGLPTYHPLLSVRSANASHLILQGLEDFREHLGGILCVTLPNPLGDKIEVAEIDQNLMIECIDWLSQRAGCPNKVLAYETPL
jgi:3-dehydroquinate synthase